MRLVLIITLQIFEIILLRYQNLTSKILIFYIYLNKIKVSFVWIFKIYTTNKILYNIFEILFTFILCLYECLPEYMFV